MAVVPDRKTFLEQAKLGNLVPVWKEVLADQETPVSAYERVRTYLRQRNNASHTYLLESVEGGENIGRYSFIGGTPRTIIRAYGRRVSPLATAFRSSRPRKALRSLNASRMCSPLRPLWKVESSGRTDGLRVTFQSSEVLHMRPSGNAPEFRCYNEANSEERVQEMQRISMEILLKLKG